MVFVKLEIDFDGFYGFYENLFNEFHEKWQLFGIC